MFVTAPSLRGISALGGLSNANFNLAAAAEDANAHGGEKVVSGVGVKVNTTVEYGGSILADGRVDEGAPTGVILDEVGHVVDDTSDSDKALALLGLGNKVIPVDNRELLERNTPVEGGALLVKLLLELLDTSLLNLVQIIHLVGSYCHH
ncbi:hypothetical protein HYQ46_005845 [Verticillium longisporum]|nr:hypothetical protein HYQ46_005845 [Verticillium longisporum]